VTVDTVQGDITREQLDAIVNAANVRLARGAGVCGAIFAAAGPELDRACAAIGGCRTGDAVHTVGPVWHGGNEGEPELLASCYRRSLEVARDAGARSIAFPAISTGIYGYPPDRAAQIAVRTVSDHVGDMHVRLVAYDEATRRLYESLLS
jgi:O-acetyl-ADP-ribose deacetylase (regulator of RNase III)